MRLHANILLAVGLTLIVESIAAGGSRRADSSHRPGLGSARPVTSALSADPNAGVPGAVVTEHTVLVQGQPLHYQATAGYLPLPDSVGKPLADIFFVAYERLDAPNVQGPDFASRPAMGGSLQAEGLGDGSSFAASHPQTAATRTRPLVFAFNGGPGASSVWLHLGAFGPKRALLDDDGTALPLTDLLVDNDATWLTFADLVFVDPVGTGFSRAAPGVEPNQFYAVQKDTEVAADFIRLFATKYERWLSPLFIVGESYGTTRAVAVARRLQDRYGLYVRGLVLLSSALNLQVISFDPGNDLPYVLAVPSYTAVAAYHGLVTPPRSDLRRYLRQVQAWALNSYLPALAQGDQFAPEETEAIARTLSQYTGLPRDPLARNHLRVSNFHFVQDLLRRENLVLGLLDGRVTAPNVATARRWTDPSLFIVVGPFVAAFNQYVRADLGFHTDRPYIYLSTQANESWNWGAGRQGYLNVAPTLAEAMGLDNRLRVFAAAGYYDLTTPYLGQQYVFHHLALPAALRRNLTFHLYPAGHQIYTSPDSLRQLTADVKAFVTAAPQ